MRRILYFLLFWLLAVPSAVQARRYTVMVSLDGFRRDYVRIYDTPFLNRLAREGVQATMQPSFPSVTFPNHYTLATGLYPDHHGIISNSFTDRKSGLRFSLSDKRTKQDPRFWRGEPIWQTAERQGLRAGVVYWPGSDVAVNGHYPTYYQDYEQKPLLTLTARVDRVLELLRLPEAERPSLVMAYFEEPDHSGHVYGPLSPETRRAVERLDMLMETLWEGLQALPIKDSINFIVTADHGMTAVDPQRVVRPADYLRAEWYERIDAGVPTQIHARPGHVDDLMAALARVSHVRAWRKEEIPDTLRYGTDPNIGDVVVLPDVGWIVTDRPMERPGGAHGFDPAANDMLVPFLAVGPDFKQGYAMTRQFSNTSVYPLLCRLLGVVPAPCDGRAADTEELLR